MKTIFEGLSKLKDVLIQAIEITQASPVGVNVMNRLNNAQRAGMF
jgi:hypothetical protein